jgi:Spy/CpxP family protein refolding chaperone
MGLNGRVVEQRLNLTADQQQQVSLLRQSLTKKLEPIWTQLDAERAEFQALWDADEPDRASILARQAEMDPLRVSVRAAYVDFRIAVHKLLTPEQRRQFAPAPAGCGHMKNGAGNGCMGGCACVDVDGDLF